MYSEVRWDRYSALGNWSSAGLASSTDYESDFLAEYDNSSSGAGYRHLYISSTTTPADFASFSTSGTLDLVLISPDCGGIDFDWHGGAYPPVLELFYEASGGSSSSTSLTAYTPARYYSSSAVTLTHTSNTFTAPAVDSTKQQAGIVYLKYSNSVNPTVTWNSVSMTRYATTTSSDPSVFLGIYYVRHPGAGSIVVSGSTSTIKMFVPVVYSYADGAEGSYISTLVSSTGNKEQFLAVNPLVSNATNYIIPTTVAGYSDYYGTTSPLMTTVTRETASGTLIFDDSSVASWDRNVGYIALNTPRYASMIGVQLFATTSRVFASSSLDVGDSVDTFRQSYQNCAFKLDGSFLGYFDYLGCLVSNLPGYFISLFIPSSEDMNYLGSYFNASLNQNSNPLGGLFTFGFYLHTLADLTPSSTANFYSVTIPSYSGGTFSTSSWALSLDSSYSIPSSLDSGIANFLSPFLTAFLVFIISYLTFRVLV